MNNNLIIRTHSTAAFTWVSDRKEFVAERSDFGGETPWTVLKEGKFDVPYCNLHNPATGRTVLFVFLHTLESSGPDYEIEGWVFGAAPEECERNPRLHGVQAVFLND
jgi:hypothetical protein